MTGFASTPSRSGLRAGWRVAARGNTHVVLLLEENHRVSKPARLCTRDLRCPAVLLPVDLPATIILSLPPCYRSHLQFQDSDVKILSGVDEGAFAWLTLNYLLGRLGGSEQDTGG